MFIGLMTYLGVSLIRGRDLATRVGALESDVEELDARTLRQIRSAAAGSKSKRHEDEDEPHLRDLVKPNGSGAVPGRPHDDRAASLAARAELLAQHRQGMIRRA